MDNGFHCTAASAFPEFSKWKFPFLYETDGFYLATLVHPGGRGGSLAHKPDLHTHVRVKVWLARRWSACVNKYYSVLRRPKYRE